MTPHEFEIFRSLLKEVFAHAKGTSMLPESLSESEADSIANLIKEQTGRAVSGRTLCNYMHDLQTKEPAKFKPSLFILDALSRFVIQMPAKAENNNGKGNPAWLLYQQQYWKGNTPDFKDTSATIKERKEEKIQSVPVPTEHPVDLTERIQKSRNRKWWRSGFMLLFMLSFTIWGVLYFSDYFGFRNFVDYFDTTNLDSLATKGWKIQDYDSTYFMDQRNQGMLTLWTLRGDSWCGVGETAYVKNIMYREIKMPERCYFKIKLVNFNPTDNWQQAGILLFEDIKTMDDQIRLTYAHTGSEFDTITRVFQAIEKINGVAFEPVHFQYTDPVDSLWLCVEKDGENYKFYYHFGTESSSYVPLGNIHSKLKPKYVAIAAYKSFYDARIKPRDIYPATIPVFFDYFKMEANY